jgi:hypothetical protein
LGLAALAPPIDELKELAERGFGEGKSGHDKRFARAQERPGRRGFGHGGQGRGVAAANVLGKGELDSLTDFCGGQFHAVKMKANEGMEKEKQVAKMFGFKFEGDFFSVPPSVRDEPKAGFATA